MVLPGDRSPFSDAERVAISPEVLADENRLDAIVERLHRAWVARERITVEFGVDQQELREPVKENRPPWRLGASFSLLRERLHFLVWNNNWDFRGEEPIWWWGRKAAAARPGIRHGGHADIVLADGTDAWVDGGPRGPVDLPVVHSESVETGRLVLAPDPGAPPAGELAPDQLAAVGHRSGPARIIAPAGSGKTRTLNARLLHLVDQAGVEPGLVTAVAYNNRAAEEMRSRLGRDDLHVRTIHSLGWRILRDARPDAELLPERSVRSLLRPLIPRQPRLNTDIVGPYIEAMADVRIALRDPGDVEQERDDVPDLARVFDGYRRRLDRRDQVDYDEQVYGAIEALLAHPGLRRKWQRRCRHLLVDEFQDLTPAYVLLLRLLASPALAVFGVGDDDQTIYGYAGADPDFLLHFERLFPGAGHHALEVNYRSPGQVVEAVTPLLANNRRRIPKIIRTPGGSDAGGLCIVEATDSTMIPETVGRIAGWLSDGAPAGEVAVLARVNSALLPVLAGLDAAGVPVSSRISPGLLSRSAMRAAIAWIRLALNPDEMWRQDLLEAFRRPSRRLNRLSSELIPSGAPLTRPDLARLAENLEVRHAQSWARWMDDLQRLVGAADAGGTVGALEELIEGIGLGRAAGLLDRGRSRVDRSAHSDDLVALRRCARVYGAPASFEENLRTLLSRHSGGSDPPGGVTLSTVHRVKGMEWDRVVVFGVDEGLMPHHLAVDVEEERRVLHVAITRGRQEVVVVADARRPSPFLREMLGGPGPAEPSEAVPEAREELADRSRPVPDPILLETLKAWRLDKAREREVRAFAVFWDRALEEIATSRPRTERELLAVRGVGPAKLAEYGEDILDLVRAAGKGHHPEREAAGAGSGTDEPPEERPDRTRPPVDEELFGRLVEWRRETARARGLPAYIVFGNRTLEEIAAFRPRTEQELLDLYGIGPSKLDEYGEDVLELVRAALRSS